MKIQCKESFQARRLGKAMSLRDLADVSGVTSFTICRAENGRPVKPTTAKKLCVALDARFEDIFEVVGKKEVGRSGKVST